MSGAHYYVKFRQSGVDLALCPTDSFAEARRYAQDILDMGGECEVFYHSTLNISDFKVYPLEGTTNGQ